MSSENELQQHVRVPAELMCEFKEFPHIDREDGISPGMAKDLQKRSGISDWESLWAKLFPEDQETLSSGEFFFPGPHRQTELAN